MSETQDPFGPFLINRFGERYLPAVNQEVFSQSGSENFYRGHFGEDIFEEDSLYVVSGSDGGLLARHILKKGFPGGTRYLFVEFPDVIQRIEKLTEEGAFPELPATIRFAAPDDWIEAANELSVSDYLYLGNLKHVKSLAAVDALFTPYLDLYNRVNNEVLSMRMRLILEIGTQIFTLRGMENLGENRCPAIHLAKKFEGKTAVLMAGGPSLIDCLDWIKANRDNLALLAVGRLAAMLRREGITPDALFNIDPHDVNFYASAEMLVHFGPETLFVNMYHAHSGLVNQWRGRSAYLGGLFPWPTEMNEKNYLFPGITVSHQALGLALEMGFSEVVLAGFDLCFSKEGYTHFKGSAEANMGPFMDQSEYRVETNGGWMAETRYDFFNAIESLGALAEAGTKRGARLINPAAAAARIPSVAHLPLEEVKIAPLEEPPHVTIAAALPEESRENRIAHYQGCLTELDRVRKEVVKIRRLTIEALDCNKRLCSRKPGSFKFKGRMDEIEKCLDEEHANYSQLVRRWKIQDFLKLTRPDKEKEWTDAEIEETGRRYYEIYRDSASAVLKWLDATRQRLRNRLEEEKPQPNYKALVNQWRLDRQPGRLYVCLDRRGEPLDPPPYPQLEKPFQELAAEFHEMVHQEENSYQDLLRTFVHPLSVRAKAVALFRAQDVERLRTFKEGLDNSGMDHKEQFALLVDGYLADLEGDVPRALDSFGKVRADILTEEALSRLSAIHLRERNLDEALEALRRMAATNPARKPQYAHLLHLTGATEKGVTLYKEYLDEVKGDFVTMLKLARILADLGRTAEATEQVLAVLSEDPDNQAAAVLSESLAAADAS